MRFPRIFLAVLLVIGGILLPALARPLAEPPPGMIGMDHDGYVVGTIEQHEHDEEAGIVPTITIHVGDVISFQNNSRWIHVVGPGDKGLLEAPGTGAMTPRTMMQENDRYTTPPWNVPGVYMITCTVHPQMNAKVVVLA